MLAHREALARLPGVAVEGGFDPAPPARERWSATGLRVYRDLRAGLTEVAPDVVVIATPPAVRGRVITDVLDAAAPRLVVVEKPLALEWAEGADLAARCRAAGAGLRVAHQLPFTPEFAALLGWVREGDLGELCEIEASCHGSLFDQGSHLLDLAGRLLGDTTLSVAACEASDDLVALAKAAPVPAWFHVDAAHLGRAWLRAELATDAGVTVRLGCGLLAPRPVAGLGPWLQKRITVTGANGRAEAHVASHAAGWIAGDPAPRWVTSSVAHYERALLGFYRSVLDDGIGDSAGAPSGADRDLATLRVLTAIQEAAPPVRSTARPRREPVVSVIMTMEDDQGIGRRAVQSWTAGQRCESEAFELIILLDAHTRDLEAGLAALLRPHDRLVRADAANEIELYHRGATLARGDILFFTEAHCTAEAEAVAEIIRFFERSEADGLCGRTIPEWRTAMAALESRMYDDGFREWSQPGSWEKVIMRAVALRREVYLAAGGLQSRYDRFAERLLAAELKRRGYRLEYAPAVGVTHLYAYRLSQLDRFIREFTEGECRYRRELGTGGVGAEFFGAPPEWDEASSVDARSDRAAFRTALQAFGARSRLAAGVRPAALGAAGRLLPRAVLGKRWLVLCYRLAALAAKASAANPLARADARYRRFRAYWDRTTEFCRVRFAVEHGETEPPEPAADGRNLLEDRAGSGRLVNVYGWEVAAGVRFRWSQPLSALRLDPGSSPLRVTLEVLPFRHRTFATRICLMYRGRVLDTVRVDERDDRTRLSLTVCPDVSSPSWLYWIAPAWRSARENGDARRLGVPLASITVAAGG
jgi:predicted dehydrogenase